MGVISRMLRKYILPRDTRDYWEKRQGMYYYQIVREWIEELSPGAWIVDVGSNITPVVAWGDFARRTMLDRRKFKKAYPGIEQIEAGWLEYAIEGEADVVVCLQVLEHLTDTEVVPFARKLLTAGKHTIISVPYKWPEDDCRWHKQDPVDLDKLVSWTGIPPVKHHIETRDNKDRLIALFSSPTQSS